MIYAGIFKLLASSTNVDCIKTDQSVCSDLSLIKVWNSQNFNLLRLWHFPFSKNRINTSPNGLIYFFSLIYCCYICQWNLFRIISYGLLFISRINQWILDRIVHVLLTFALLANGVYTFLPFYDSNFF